MQRDVYVFLGHIGPSYTLGLRYTKYFKTRPVDVQRDLYVYLEHIRCDVSSAVSYTLDFRYTQYKYAYI